MFFILFTVVLVLSILLGSITGAVIMLLWETLTQRVIMGVTLDCVVAIIFATLALTAEIGIPAVAIICATC